MFLKPTDRVVFNLFKSFFLSLTIYKISMKMEHLSKGQFQISKFVLYFEAQAEGRSLLGDLIETKITKFSKGTTQIFFP